MIKRLLPLLCLVPLAAFAANPRSVALTIQETGRAQIAETHDIPPPGPDGLLRIAPLPETLLPSSVNILPVGRGDPLDILSQRYAYDLLDPASLFRAFYGRTISALHGAESVSGRLVSPPDFAGPVPSMTLSPDNQSLRFIPDLTDLDAVEFPARADIAREPTLLWQPAAGQVPPASVQIHYAANGLAWSACHEAILAEDGRSIALSTRVCLQNQTRRDFANARVRLALSDKGRFAPLVPDPSDPRAARAPALRYSADGASWIPERAAASAATVASYDLLQPLNLPAGSNVRAELAAIPALPVETRYVYDGVRFDRYQRNRRTDSNLGTEFSPAVETRLSFQNGPSASLPPGPFQLLRGESDRAMNWLGTDWLPPLAPDEEITLNLGPAADLSGRRTRTSYTEITPFKVAEESFEITLENHTPADQIVTVVEHLYRGDNHEITAASAEYTPGSDPNSIQFEVPVKAASRQSITYTVKYTW